MADRHRDRERETGRERVCVCVCVIVCVYQQTSASVHDYYILTPMCKLCSFNFYVMKKKRKKDILSLHLSAWL